MLLAMEWDGSVPLVDPLCGSGTIPIEAALLARRIPPGWRRRFAFERWPEFKPSVWEYVRGEAEKEILERAAVPIVAADRDAGAVEACAANAERAGVAGDLSILRAALTTTLSDPEVAALPPGLVLTNPPYGVRVGESGRLRDLYASLGNAMRGPLAGLVARLRDVRSGAGGRDRAAARVGHAGYLHRRAPDPALTDVVECDTIYGLTKETFTLLNSRLYSRDRHPPSATPPWLEGL